jgi:hypothetical protein
VVQPETAAQNRRVAIAELTALIALCALGLVVRLRGIGYLLPVMPLSDGIHIIRQVDVLHGKSDLASKEKFFYPQLLPRTTALFPDAGRTGPSPATPLESHLDMASEPWRQVRIVSALLSILIVPGTWLLARRFLSGAWPLLAAALVATSLLHVVFSTQEKPHGMLAAFLVLSTVAAMRVRERGDVASYLCFGAAAGLAVGSIHSGATVLSLFPAVFLLRDKRPGRASAWWILASLALVAVAAWLCYPGLFSGESAPPPPPNPGAPGKSILDVSGHLVSLDRFRGGGFRVMFETLWSYDPVIFFTSLLGLAVALVALARRGVALEIGRRKDLAIALSFALPYFVVVGMYDLSLERFTMPLLPYFACLATFGVATLLGALARKIGEVSAAKKIVSATAAILPAVALVPDWHLGTVREAPDTFARAAACLEKSARPREDRIVIVPSLDLPLLHGEASLRENAKHPMRSNWVRYQMQLGPGERVGPEYEVYVSPKSIAEAQRELESDPMAYFRDAGARYVVLAVEADATGLLARVRDVVRTNAELVCRVTPRAHDDGSTTVFLYRYLSDPWQLPFFRFVMQMECTGNTLEVYRLR